MMSEIFEVVLITIIKNTWMERLLKATYIALKKLLPSDAAIISATVVTVAAGILTMAATAVVVIGCIIILLLLF